MANHIAGEVSFEFEGNKYTLVFDFNAMVEFEDATGENAMHALKLYDEGRLTAKMARALFWAMLQEHHPEVDLRDAGRMAIPASEALGRALTAAAVKPESAANSGNARRRAKPARK